MPKGAGVRGGVGVGLVLVGSQKPNLLRCDLWGVHDSLWLDAEYGGVDVHFSGEKVHSSDLILRGKCYF